MKKLLLTVFVILISSITVLAEPSPVIKAGVSMVDKLPKQFFGTWQVLSKLEHSDNDKIFKESGVDLWNLSRFNDVLNLSNPISGASAELRLDYVGNNIIKFSKVERVDDTRLTDVVNVKIDGNKFAGYNELTLEVYSPATKKIVKTSTATYKLNGSKLTGKSISED